jgi:hypothetical protein
MGIRFTERGIKDYLLFLLSSYQRSTIGGAGPEGVATGSGAELAEYR